MISRRKRKISRREGIVGVLKFSSMSKTKSPLYPFPALWMQPITPLHSYRCKRCSKWSMICKSTYSHIYCLAALWTTIGSPVAGDGEVAKYCKFLRKKTHIFLTFWSDFALKISAKPKRQVEEIKAPTTPKPLSPSKPAPTNTSDLQAHSGNICINQQRLW